jgi:large subunit ribosomal protein L29
MKLKEIKELPKEEKLKKLKELKYELMHELGTSAMGGAPTSPGKIKALRKSIARILTILKEEEKKE